MGPAPSSLTDVPRAVRPAALFSFKGRQEEASLESTARKSIHGTCVTALGALGLKYLISDQRKNH